ncbi:MAG: protoporphyrinogen oxidase [Flavobacteriales bacterium]|nr:protoporphyrinogen oxidase [Flavobacteriales bacterium]
MENEFDHIVVGGGISGLSRAYTLQKTGLKVLLIEKNNRTGGVIRSESSEFGITELGPNSLALNPSVITLIKELGIEDQMIKADPIANKRYIFLKGKPVLINPKTLLFSNKVISFGSKVKLLTERFKPSKNIPRESLSQVIQRRFNKEILTNLVEPVITGIYAGSPDKLEYSSSMKRMFTMEQEHGSFTKGFLASRKSGNKRDIVSFSNGLQALTNALESKLNNVLNAEVLEINQSANGINVITNNGSYLSKDITLATPSYVSGKLLNGIDPQIADLLKSIEYPSLLGWQVTYKTESIVNRIPAFGILFPAISGKSIKGIINYSEIFGKNDEIRHFTVFAAALPEEIEVVKSKIQDEFRSVIKVTDQPIESIFTFYEKAIPQFNVGHEELLKQVDLWENNHPNIKLLGNWRTGVAIGDCIN